MMVFSNLLQKSQVLIAENSAALLTGTGVIGVATTAVLTGRASFKAAEVIRDTQDTLIDEDNNILTQGDVDATFPTSEKVRLTWPLFVPPVAAGVTTIGAIVFSYRISASKSAAMAAAYGISEKAFSEYKEKVLEKVGVKKENDIKDAVAKDRVEGKEPTTIIITGGGDVLCYDSYSDRYFQSSVEAIKKAEIAVNTEIGHHGSCSLGHFYDELEVDQTGYSNDLGWDTTNPLDLSISTQMAKDNRPCLVITFENSPSPSYTPASYS